MAPISICIRYHVENDSYFIQVRGAQYNRLDKKIKNIRRSIEHLPDEGNGEKKRQLEQYRKRLRQERQQAQYYIKIPVSDIPDNVHIRPIHEAPEQVLVVRAERYAQLLEQLRESGKPGKS